MIISNEPGEGDVMRRAGFGLVYLMTVFASASACRPHVPTPTVTAKGSAGEEDVPDLTIP
jgi:hypothetical protein